MFIITIDTSRGTVPTPPTLADDGNNNAITCLALSITNGNVHPLFPPDRMLPNVPSERISQCKKPSQKALLSCNVFFTNCGNGDEA